MHANQHDAMERLVRKYFPKPNPGEILTVRDIGSYDVNGSHKGTMVNHGYNYVGVDMTPGPNVDLVLPPYDWSSDPDKWPYIISGSCLEHVEFAWLWAIEIRKKLPPGGLFACVLPYSIGEHRYPVDCWRILPDGLRALFEKHAGIKCLECAFTNNGADVGHGVDTYFMGQG